MNDKPTPTPMTAEEFISNNYSYSKEPLAWRLFKGSVASLMNDYADYRLRFEQEQQPQPLDPFEGAPEWAEWRAADRDGGEHWYAQEPQQEDFLGIHDANGFYMRCPDRRLTYSDWRQSPVKRKR